MGLMHVWIQHYVSPKKEKISFWIFHLKAPAYPADKKSDWLVYDTEEGMWTNLNEEFTVSDDTCERVVSYEKLKRAWQNMFQYTNPPFCLNDIVARELQVWTSYPPINGDPKTQYPVEDVTWIFHLNKTITRCQCEWIGWRLGLGDEEDNKWFALNAKDPLIDTYHRHHVEFENLEIEWERMFSRPEIQCPFKITDIAEKIEKK